MSIVDEIEAGLKYHGKWDGSLLVKRDDLAALCRYVRAVETYMENHRLALPDELFGPCESWTDLQSARRELKLKE